MGAAVIARRVVRVPRLINHVVLGALLAHLVLPWLERRAPSAAVGMAGYPIIRWWTAKACRILGVRVTVRGEPCADPCFVVANHISWLDIPVLLSQVNVRLVSKAEVRDWPVVGGMAARARTVFIQRGDHGQTRDVIDQITNGLQQRHNMLVFPEGTATDGLGVRRFHGRLYQAAIRAGTPVQALALTYPHRAATVHPAVPFTGDDTLPRSLWRVLGARDVEATLVFCEPLMTHTHDRRSLATLTREQVVAALGLPSAPPERNPRAA